MTQGEGKYNALNLDKNLMELVKLEYAMKKHFVYIDHIDDLKHTEAVIKDFDKAINLVGNLINGVKKLRNSL